MALPLPKVVPDTMPGGNFITSMMGANALRQSNLENQIKQVQAKYAPLTTQAEAASKLAYANLMGPQFLAKLMGHPEILANMSEDQRNQALKMVYGAGTGQGTGANFLNNLPQPKDQSLFGMLKNKLGSIFSPSSEGQAPQAQVSQNAPMAQQSQFNPQDVQSAVQAYRNSPEAQQRAQQEGMFTIPNVNELMNWYQQNRGNVPAPQPVIEKPIVTSKTWPEKYGEFKGIEKEGEERGKLRADALNDMAKEYQASIRLNDSYDEMKNLINDPAFQKMRANIPFFQNMQMKALSKIGTPYEQEMIGTFKSAAQKILANAVNSFEGRKFVGEFKTTNDMKINENDTFNTIVGKMQAGMLLNNFDQQRMAIASRLMKDQHLDQQEAVEMADKQLDRKKIESDIKNLIRITIKNKKTGEVRTIPIHEARKMGVPNV